MKLFLIPACLALLFFSSRCFGQIKKEGTIDLQYQDCRDRDSTVANVCDCAFIAYGKWNKELESVYKKLLKTLKKEEEKSALKQSQTAWESYRDAEFKSYDYMFNMQGLKWCSLRQDGRIDIVRTRVLQLQNYLEALKNK